MAHNPDALDKTLADVDAQLGDARDRGDFIKADELYATLSGLKASVAEARENIVDGKFKLECSILEQQREREAMTVTRGMRRMENDVNMHIEARVADLEVRASPCPLPLIPHPLALRTVLNRFRPASVPQRIHQKERSELEQLLQDKVKLEFTPTPEMLAIKACVEHLLRARNFDKAEVARRDLINQEQKDRRTFAESLWRSWGCRRNKLAYKQSIERARCESDVASRKAMYQVDQKDAKTTVERKHQYHMQCLAEKYTKLNNHARTTTKNAQLRLPPMKASGGIPVSVSEGEDETRSANMLLDGPKGRILVKGWVFRKGNGKIGLAGKGKENGRPKSSGMIMGPEGRIKVRTKRSQSAGGEVAAMRWDHQYAVLTRHSGIHLYTSQDAFEAGESAVSHMELGNGELRVPREDDTEVNWAPSRLVLELINVCTSTMGPPDVEGCEPQLVKEIRLVCLKIDTDKPVLERHAEMQAWEHHLNKCMRTHGQVDTVLMVANRLGAAVLQQHNHSHGGSNGASASAHDPGHHNGAHSMHDVHASQSDGSLPDYGAVTSIAVGDGKKATWTNQAFKQRWY